MIKLDHAYSLFIISFYLSVYFVHYQYKAVAFSGVRTYSGVASGGTRICGVVACTGDATDTCGSRFSTYDANTVALFEELNIVATVPTPVMVSELQAYDSAFFPVASKPSIMPLEPREYDYQVARQGNVTVYNFTLNNHDAELYSFAVWGRVYDRDGQEPTPALNAANDFSNKIIVHSVLLASLSALIMYY